MTTVIDDNSVTPDATSIDDTDSPYSTQGENRVEVDTTNGPVTVTLSSSDVTSGFSILIVDVGENAATNNITINTEGSENINPGTNSSITLTVDGTYRQLWSDGSNWFTDTSSEFTSVNTGEINNAVQVGPNDNLQSKIDEAGVGGELDWEAGTYSVGTPLVPKDGQKWDLGESVEFQPTGDNIVIDCSGLTEAEFTNTLRIADPSSNQTTTEALKWDQTIGCEFDRIRLSGVYNGLRTFASSDGTKENHVGSFYASAIRNRGLWLSGQTHDNHFESVICLGTGTSDHGIIIDTSGIDGGNQLGNVLSLGWGGDGMQVSSLNREFWVGIAILDSNSGHGFNHFADGNRAFFFDTLWTSGNTLTGARVSGTSTTPISEGQIGQIYSIGNGQEGVICEYTDGMQIGQIHSEDNDDGLVLANGESDNFRCGYLATKAITNNALNGVSAGTDCVIGQLGPISGAISNPTNFRTIGGVGQESANAETPTAANFRIGEIVNFTDTGDGSGTGYYIKNMNGNMDQIA